MLVAIIYKYPRIKVVLFFSFPCGSIFFKFSAISLCYFCQIKTFLKIGVKGQVKWLQPWNTNTSDVWIPSTVFLEVSLPLMLNPSSEMQTYPSPKWPVPSLSSFERKLFFIWSEISFSITPIQSFWEGTHPLCDIICEEWKEIYVSYFTFKLTSEA